MAYFLGLIAADGHVRHQNNLLMINLKQTDHQIIENLKAALKYDGPIYTINKKDGQTQSALSVSSKEIVKDLAELGLTGNKTYDFDWINGIPEEFVSHFVRGIFDGDGCIHINQKSGNIVASIVGTYKLTENIKMYYNEFSGHLSGCLQAKDNVQNLAFNGRYNALAFLNWIYQDSTQSTRLERKYELYQTLKNTICEEDQTPNNSQINQAIAIEMRVKHSSGKTVQELSKEFQVTETLIYDAISNRTWTDPSYHPDKKKQDTIYISHNNKTQTIQEWSDELGIPYSTIDRRHRQGLPTEQILNNSEKRINLGKTQSEKDKIAYDLAFNIRTDYKNGLKGKSSYESKYGIKKSRYIDIIGNRICREDFVWWVN